MSNIKLFEDKQIRSVWNKDEESWYFSVVDVIGVLTESPDPRNYWKVLKHRMKKEGNESVTNCNQLKLQSTDGEFYKTDVASTEQLLRLIQSIPSPKAEPFKLWLAQTGYERIEEIQDPEKSIDRAMENYLKLG
jgi:prophage antirepressor-like protein